MKNLRYITLIVLISCGLGADEDQIQAQIDEAVSDALQDTTTTSTTTTTTSIPETTTTTVNMVCLDYVDGLLLLWDDLYIEIENIGIVYDELASGTVTYSDAANEFFAINLRWEKLVNEVRNLSPDTKNKKFHDKLLTSFNHLSEANEIAIKGLDEIDPDLIVRATSLIDVSYESLGEALTLIPGGTLYGMKDDC